MSTGRFNREFKCPWCGKGKFFADGKGKISVSIQCSKCGRCYIGDLDTSRTSCSSSLKSK